MMLKATATQSQAFHGTRIRHRSGAAWLAKPASLRAGRKHVACVAQAVTNTVAVPAVTLAAAGQPISVYFSTAAPTPVLAPSTPTFAPDLIPTPTVEEKQEIMDLFHIWNAALQTGNPEVVANLYAPDAILLPTVSNQVRTDHESRVDYFTQFLQIKPFGTLNESYVRFLHPSKDLAANSGVYTFRIVKDGKEQHVTARYTYVYRKIAGGWMIVEHHSSAMPEPHGEAAIAALFGQWNAALQTGNPEAVADLYADDAILLPTVSNQVLKTRAERVDYFKTFLQIKPLGTINESHIRYLSPTIAANSGVYTFRIERDGEESEVTARYSFMYRKVGNTWKIIEHHSSAMPEPVAVAPKVVKVHEATTIAPANKTLVSAAA